MEQKISIVIAGQTFKLTVQTQEQEELLRGAAEVINKRFQGYTASHPGKTAMDLMSMVALNETVARLTLQKEMGSLKEAEKLLQSDLEHYLKDSTQ